MSLIAGKLKSLAHNWRVKLAVQNTLSFLPRNAGFKTNDLLTQFTRRDIGDRLDIKARFIKGINNINLLYVHANGFTLKDKTILELGTGWHGIDLVIFYLLGARNIITIDHHPHLTLANIVSSIAFLKNPECIRCLGELALVPERVSLLEASVIQASSLSELLKLLAIDYRIVASAEYKHLTINQRPVHFFYSESVLQRIPEKHLQDLFHVVSSNLSNDALIFHRTDQKDINAQKHVDTQLWALNYLQYSELFFNFFLSNKFNTQNRLRESDFIQLLGESGMIPIYLESYCRKDDIDKLRKFKVARRFKDKTTEDLSFRSSKIICRKRLHPSFVDLKHKIICS